MELARCRPDKPCTGWCLARDNVIETVLEYLSKGR